MKTHALRLMPNSDLKRELLTWSLTHKIEAACIITCVGSLKNLNIRLANAQNSTEIKALFEIVSLVGTFSSESGHFHISVADESGQVIGGHLLDHNIIHTTAEIIIGELTQYKFKRETDASTGYKELIAELIDKN